VADLERWAKFMKITCLLIFLFCAAVCSGANLRLTERVAVSLRDAPSESLAIDREAVRKLAIAHAARDIALPDGVQMHVEWGDPAAYCEKVGQLGRVALHSWKTGMEAASQKTFPRNEGWVSSSNVERLGDSATLVVYRFARKAEDGKIQFRTIVDVFGQSILGSMTFSWLGVDGDGAEARVGATIDSISVTE
jgi:hypothetical protein